MLLPTCPYRPCTPPPPTMPRSANSHPHIFQPNHPARDTLHPRTTHTKHTSPLPALLDGTGLLQMSSKGTSHKVERDRITTKRSQTKDARKPQMTHEPHTRPPSHNDTYAHQSGNQSIPDKHPPPLAHTKPKPTTHTLRATSFSALSEAPLALPSTHVDHQTTTPHTHVGMVDPTIRPCKIPRPPVPSLNTTLTP